MIWKMRINDLGFFFFFARQNLFDDRNGNQEADFFLFLGLFH